VPKLRILVDIMGSAFVASDRFTKGRIGTAWKTGKVSDFLFGKAAPACRGGIGPSGPGSN